MNSDTIEERNEPDVQIQMSGRKVVWPIYALFTGNIVSCVGNTLTLLAIPWLVLQTTGSVAQAGIVGFFSLLSTIGSSALSSVLVHRLSDNRCRFVDVHLS